MRPNWKVLCVLWPPYSTNSSTMKNRLKIRNLAGILRFAEMALLVLVSAQVVGLTSASAQDSSNPALLKASQATVFLMQTYELEGTQVLSCVGSGTLVSGTGLILTNSHLVTAAGPCRGDRIVVSLPVRLDEPPVPTYVAEPLQVDERLDLAVLQISGGLDGSVIVSSSLNLPSVELGDPSGVLPGTTLSLVGYPDISNTSVTSIDTPVVGVTAEQSGGSLAWLRIGVEWGGAASGGGAYDANGRLMGIPTSAPPTDGRTAGPGCLSVQDNTGDGLITEQDACVPIGGPIAQIRPITFAAPLVEAAREGLASRHRTGSPVVAPPAEPSFSRLFFSTGVSSGGVPTQIVGSVPSGATSLYLFFDYAAMRAGTPYELRVTQNGLEMPQLSLGPLAWGGKRQGTWFIGTENFAWPDGDYEFTLLLNGQPVAAQSITVGSAPVEPVFSNLTFGVPSAAGGFGVTGTLLPAQVTQVDARFDFQGMSDGQTWTEIWYLDGTELPPRLTHVWDKGPSGQAVVSAINYGGLPSGTYRLDLLVGDRLVATGDFYLAGNTGPQGGPAVFSNARSASGISRDGQPDGQIGSIMPLGTAGVYVFVDWDFMPNGLLWTYRWLLDGRMIASSTQVWDSGGVGTDFWLSLTSASELPEGAYTLDVVVENQPMFSHNVSVGSGTQPQRGVETAADEVVISGTILDAVTGRGITDAEIIVLDVAFESAQFTWDESEIHTQALSDQRGRFSLPRGLPRGQYYTVYVFADGYITIVEDNFTILSTQTSPVDIKIEMGRP